MVLHRSKKTLFVAVSMALLISGCNDSSTKSSFAKPANYAGFPVTLKNAPGSHSSSVAYTGQMVRQVYRETVKAVVKAPGTTGAIATADKVKRYLINPDNVAAGDNIIAPKDKTGFNIKETSYSEIGKGGLHSKAFDTSSSQADAIPGVSTGDANITMGVPGNKSAQQTLDLWVADFANNHSTTSDIYVNMTTGYDYNQLFPKFLMGAVFYNQAVDKYLDEYIAVAGTKDNVEPYGTGKHYTGKEHSWDEGFGYWGAAANYGALTAEQNYNVKKQKSANFANADLNKDKAVSLYTEYTSGPAYYAASFDRDDKGSTYGKDMMNAWLNGRTLIANAVDVNGDARNLTDAERTSLKAYAVTIQRNWEMVLAEAVYKYAGTAHSTLATLQLDPTNTTKQKAYYKQWGELKGFMLSLQYGGVNSKINKAKFVEIDNLVGFGPVLANGSQVTGVTGNTFVVTALASGTADAAVDAYQVKLKSVQTKLNAFYTLKVKQKTI